MNAPNKFEVIEQPSNPVAITPMTMLSMAVSQGADIDKLEKLMQLQERWEANEARKAFSEALTAFKYEPLTIDKDKHVKFGNTEYNHATLGNVCNVIGAALSRHGLSYRWNTEQSDGKIKVSCVLMHVKGHSESISLEAVADSSGAKNGIQAIGSTVSYLQRYTLLAITGTATQEQDDDGRSTSVKMNAGVLADYLAAIDSAENMSALGKAYIPAIEIASVAKDIAAMDMLNEAKLERIEKIKGSSK